MVDVNVLVRGQSNALLFVDYGGAGAMEAALERNLSAQFGQDVDVHLLAEWGSDSSTIHSGTRFLDWDTDGQQQSLLNFVNGMSADLKDNPTVTLWMHNESDGNSSGWDSAEWEAEVRADAAMVRDALGQDAGTTPYVFSWVPYNYSQGDSPEMIRDGMTRLAQDGGFNASLAWDATSGIAMDGDGYSNSSHMGRDDARVVGERLADALDDVVAQLVDGSGGNEPPDPSEPPDDGDDGEPQELAFGSGPDTLVLHVSQDAYQGDAQYAVSVDGLRVGPVLTASALRANGEHDTLTLRGDWGGGARTVTVEFLNDLWVPGVGDRNLYVTHATYNGVEAGAPADGGWVGGSATLDVGGADHGGGGLVLEGTAGADTLVGGAEADVLDGGAGGDRLAGRGGADLIVLSEGDGQDRVAKFRPGVDSLRLEGVDEGTVRAEVVSRGTRQGLEVRYGEGDDSVFLIGVAALAEGDILFA